MATSSAFTINASQPVQAYELTDGATIAVDWNNGKTQYVTLTGNRTVTLANPVNGGRYALYVAQDATGSRTLAFPGGINWKGGTPPTLSTDADTTDVITLIYIDGEYYGNSSVGY